MRYTKSSSIVVCLALAACPGSDPMTTSASSSDSDGTTDASGSSTVASGDPTTETSATPTTTVAPTTGEPGTTSETTGGGPDAVTRVVYYTYIDVMGQPRADAMRSVEIVDGVASPSSTILDAPGTLTTVDATHGRRWSSLYTGGLDPAQLWLIDMVSLVPHEIALPQEIERVLTVRPSRDDAYLIVLGGPQGNNPQEDDP